MKKIISLFFTFSGICSCFSQGIPQKADSVAIQHKVANTLPLKTDSIQVKAKALVRLYPNPARNKVEIEIKGFAPGYIKLQMLNNTGKIIREEKRLALTGNELIMFMFSESPGLYYLLLKQGAQTVRSKFIVQ